MTTGTPSAGSILGACRPGRSGFTLIEILIALAIFAMGGAILYALIGDGLDRQGRAERLQRAVTEAESMLARLGQDIPLRPGRVEGETQDRFSWRLDLRAEDAADNPTLRLIDVELVLTWTEGLRDRHLRVATRRVAAAS